MNRKTYKLTTNTEQLGERFEQLREAAEAYRTFDQEAIDKIFRAAATAANQSRIELAKMAFEETKMGVFEDKVIKNHFSAEYIYNAYKNTKTCGVIEQDDASGIMKIAEPVGVVAAIIPTTNPTSTTIFKALLALKTRNAIIVSPHPRAKASTIAAAKIVLEAAVAAGAPSGIIAWIDEPSLTLTKMAMECADLTLATGGPSMVKAAYSSGKPAIGVGSGNTPSIIDESADIPLAVNSIIHSKVFDNGMICASEQAVIVHGSRFLAVTEEFKRRGCHILTAEETAKLREIILVNGSLNAKIVGQKPSIIANLAGFSVPEETKILLAEVEDPTENEPLAHEKLSPVLAFYRFSEFEQALEIAKTLIEHGGLGHTSSIFINERAQQERLAAFRAAMKTCRIVVNTPASHGGIGDLYNFALAPSLTLGCGSWGGNSVYENVGAKHLLNIKTIASRRENMLWFRVPQRVYFKKGCLSVALDELPTLGRKRAVIVTDTFLYKNGFTRALEAKLDQIGCTHTTFFSVQPDPTLACTREGAELMQKFEPDVIIAFGGGSAIDAAKIMWVQYEHPCTDFAEMAMRFADIRKKIYPFPRLGEKAMMVAIPTTAGTGAEVTPFAVITDEKTHIKYPIADYELLPQMAIIDPNLMLSAPKNLTAASGIDALTHAVEAFLSVMASDYTDALALHATKIIFEFLPRAYRDGGDEVAREKTANAATMAGMAFGNAFLGVCHAMSHKLGAFFALPHGLANALLINEVIRFNASDAPSKMGSFPQYAYPCAKKRYAEILSYLAIPAKNDDEAVEKLIEKINVLKGEIGIKAGIRDYLPDEKLFLSKVDEMALQAFDDLCIGANPRFPLVEEIKQMFINAY